MYVLAKLIDSCYLDLRMRGGLNSMHCMHALQPCRFWCLVHMCNTAGSRPLQLSGRWDVPESPAVRPDTRAATADPAYPTP
jgi:hypothetical protein